MTKTTEDLKALSNQNFIAWDDQDEEYMREWLRDYGYDRDEDFPEWFREMIARIRSRKTTYSQFNGFDAQNSDMGSLLQELANRYRWSIDDGGEVVHMKFPALKVEAFIDRTASWPNGQSCYSYKVVATS